MFAKCPTCDAAWADISDGKIFWCPTCGTLKFTSAVSDQIVQTGWVKYIAGAAIGQPRHGHAQSNRLAGEFFVNQRDEDWPKVELRVNQRK